MQEQPAQTYASQGPETAQHHLARHNVLAAFEDMDAARMAMEELGRSGISGQKISLLGPAADVAAEQTNTAASDAKMMGRWFGAVAQFAAVGGAIGAVIGVPLGLAVLSAYGSDVTLGSVLLAAALSALGLATALGLVGSMYKMQDADAWELTFHRTHRGRVVVGVHSDDKPDVDKAGVVFGSGKAAEIRFMRASRRDPTDTANAMAAGRR